MIRMFLKVKRSMLIDMGEMIGIASVFELELNERVTTGIEGVKYACEELVMGLGS